MSLLSRGFWLGKCRVIVRSIMETSPTPSAQPPVLRSWWRETDAPPAVGPFPGQFSSLVSWLAAIFLVASFASVAVMASALPKIDRIEAPEQALSLMVSRTMEVRAGFKRAPAWEQQWLAWVSGDEVAEQALAIDWYRDLEKQSDDPLIAFQLAILQAEAGQVSQALLSAHEWNERADPLPRFAGFIRAAYSEGPPPKQEIAAKMQAELGELLPVGWFHDRVATRLARRTGQAALASSIDEQAAARADRLYAHSRRLTMIELGAMLVGTVLLVMIWLWRTAGINPIRLHEPGIPPPWPGRVGTAVLLRGGAIGAMVMAFCLIYMPPENASLRALAIPMTNVPLLALAYYHLFRPAGMTFEEGFGLSLPWSHFWRLMAAVLTVVAAGLWGEWVMDRALEQWHLTSHWTEWFDGDLVWGSSSLTMVSLLEYVLLAPVFEELAFRGLLFAILRRKFRFLPAALISAGIFGLAHGYGVVGLISVCWSGVLWAWIYEKTGSLAPGILAHAINNLLVCLAVMALLRW
jgi:CAAX protease family protein